MVNVTTIVEVPVLVIIAAGTLPVPLNGNVVLSPPGLFLVQDNVVPGTLLGFVITIDAMGVAVV